MWQAGEHALAHLGTVALRATVVLVAGIVVTAVLRRGAAAARRRVWAAVIVALAALPVVGHVLPAVPVRILPAQEALPVNRPEAPQSLGAQPERSNPSFRVASDAKSHATTITAPRAARWRSLLVVLWLSGFVVLLLRTVRSRLAAARLVRRSRPVDPSLWSVPADIRVRESEETDVPMTVGTIRPLIIVPGSGRGWPAEWRAAAAAHEAAHVRSRDPLVQALSELVTALYWLHPLVWLAAWQLRVERELAADDQVLQAGTRASAYAELLASQAYVPLTPRPGAVVPLLTPSGLRARLCGVLDGARVRVVHGWTNAALAAIGAIVGLPAAFALPLAQTTAHGALGHPDRPGAFVPLLQVLDGQTGMPVPDAEVTPEFPHLSGKTDADGRFLLRKTLGVTDQGSPDYRVYVRKGRLAARKQVRGEGAATAPVTLKVYPAHAIEGVVRDDEGRPRPGVSIHFMESQPWAFGPDWQLGAVSDSQGRFRIEGVLHGRYRFVAAGPPGIVGLKTVEVVEQDVRNVLILVSSQRADTVIATDEAGRSIGGAVATRGDVATALALPPRGQRYFAWDRAGPDGVVRLLALGRRLSLVARRPDGQVLVGSWQGSGVPLEEGREFRSPMKVVLRPAAYITGALRWPAPVSRMGAVLARPQGVLENRTAGAGTTIDATGRFTLGPLEPGTWRLEVLGHDEPLGATNRIVTVAAGARVDIGHVRMRSHQQSNTER